MPKVSVIMPVFNGERYLREAIESVLHQSFSNFEFLIMNDGSTDNSLKIITSYSDSRIKLVSNEKNKGLIFTLNRALELATGEYIVRMDCDDVCVKNRLAIQVRFMEKNKKIGASGSYYTINVNGKKAVADFPLSDEEIRAFMIFACPIAHPTAIVRTSIIEKYNLRYREEYIHSEDYDFWSQIAEITQLANVSDKLLEYRIHNSQVTVNKNFEDKRNQSVSKIRSSHLKMINIIPTSKELEIHNLIGDARKPESIEQLNEAEMWLGKLIKAGSKTQKKYLEKIVLERWMRLCFNFYGGLQGLKNARKSQLYKTIKLSPVRKLELIKGFYYSWKRLRIK